MKKNPEQVAIQPTQQTNTERLFAHLHRGGGYAHLWTDAGHTSYWFRTDRASRRRVPKRWLNHNIYFSVHPLAQIPPQNSSGSGDRRYISSQTDYIGAINALFAEFDSKDTVLPLEYAPYLPAGFRVMTVAEKLTATKTAKEMLFYRSPQRFKARTLHQLRALPYPPSVIVDSGGGFHCYWLLRATVPLDATNRNDVQIIQNGWVKVVGGDPGAADLRRVLRVPGTFNRKAAFGKHAPQVHFVKTDFDLLYDYTTFEELVNDWLYSQRAKQRRRQRTQLFQEEKLERRAHFNQHHSLIELLCTHGYQLSFQQGSQTRLARPGRDRYHSSVVVFAAHGDVPERSVHFSTNDPLYSTERVNDQSGQLRRRVYDAFAVYTLLEHGGDWQAAFDAAAKEGMRTN
ncbi:MAG: hypothetical protein KF832_02255 [Caldilineaceae bacterium]|nr:hypothetical protein [Caldilineaceae bacterium]